MSACVYAPGPHGYCLDLTCGRQGGRCEYREPPGRRACRCTAAAPSPNRGETLEGIPMDTALTQYKSVVDAQPPLDDGWFAEALSQTRRGDDEARRRILGSGLRLALAVAESVAPTRPDVPFWDLVQEANAALTRSLERFAGGAAADFAAQADRDIREHLRGVTADEDEPAA